MCRPLPQKSFPKPPPTPAPPGKCSTPHFFWVFFLTIIAIVGSAGWLAARSANPTASPTPSSTRKSKKAAPSDTASVISSGSRSTKSFSPPPAPSPAPSSVMANYRAKNDSACTSSDSFFLNECAHLSTECVYRETRASFGSSFGFFRSVSYRIACTQHRQRLKRSVLARTSARSSWPGFRAHITVSNIRTLRLERGCRAL